jgi:hypothetical protein
VTKGSSENILFEKNDSNKIEIKKDSLIHKGNLTGGRSRKAIMSVVMQNLHNLKDAYNKRLKSKPGFGGKLWVKYAIDEFGKVVYCEAIQDSLGDDSLKIQIVQIVKTWKFENIYKPGDITEVVYPFVFSPPSYSPYGYRSEFKGKVNLIPLLIILGLVGIIISFVITNQNH